MREREADVCPVGTGYPGLPGEFGRSSIVRPAETGYPGLPGEFGRRARGLSDARLGGERALLTSTLRGKECVCSHRRTGQLKNLSSVISPGIEEKDPLLC